MTISITLTTEQAAEIMRGPIKYVAKMKQPPEDVTSMVNLRMMENMRSSVHIPT